MLFFVGSIKTSCQKGKHTGSIISEFNFVIIKFNARFNVYLKVDKKLSDH